MIDGRILVTVASIVAAFGLTTLMFRVQRELGLRERGMPTWIAWSDWLLIAATVGCMLFVVLPLVTFATLPRALSKVPSAVCAGASILRRLHLRHSGALPAPVLARRYEDAARVRRTSRAHDRRGDRPAGARHTAPHRRHVGAARSSRCTGAYVVPWPAVYFLTTAVMECSARRGGLGARRENWMDDASTGPRLVRRGRRDIAR